MTETMQHKPAEAAPIHPEEARVVGQVMLAGAQMETRERQSTDPFAPHYFDPGYEVPAEKPFIPHNKKELAEMVLDDEIRDGVRWKVEEAANRSEFVHTLELDKGLKSFYESHYAMSGVLEMGLRDPKDTTAAEEQTPALEQVLASSIHSREDISGGVKQLVEYGTDGSDPRSRYVEDTLPLLAAVRLERFKDPDNKQLERAELNAQLIACQTLFSELSVGTTTVGQKEIDTIQRLHDGIVARINESGLFEYDATNSRFTPIDPRGLLAPAELRSAKPMLMDKLAFTDTIAARGPAANIETAQKLFWNDARHAGQLLYHNTSNFRSLWQSGAIRTRRVQLEKAGKLADNTMATKSGSNGNGDFHHSPTVHFSEYFAPRSYRGNPGSLDAGTLAIPMAEVVKATPYARNAEYGVLHLKPGSQALANVVLNAKVEETGFGSDDLQGQFGSDRTFYRSPHDADPTEPLEQAPDGYEYNFRDTPMTRILLGSQEQENNLTHAWGSGENLPRAYAIDADTSSLAGEKQIEARIQQLQQETLAKYPGQVIVPLRSGIMDFWVPDDGHYPGRKLARFTRMVDTTPANHVA